MFVLQTVAVWALRVLWALANRCAVLLQQQLQLQQQQQQQQQQQHTEPFLCVIGSCMRAATQLALTSPFLAPLQVRSNSSNSSSSTISCCCCCCCTVGCFSSGNNCSKRCD